MNQMLHDYREHLGRCRSLEQEIKEIEATLQRLRASMVADAAAPGSQNMDGMPRGTAIGNPTERIGGMFADGYVPEYIRELEEELTAKRAEYQRISATVVFVGAWLEGLADRERWIIETQVIDGVPWRRVVAMYREKYGEIRTRDGLKKLRLRALEKIYRMAL